MGPYVQFRGYEEVKDIDMDDLRMNLDFVVEDDDLCSDWEIQDEIAD